MVIAFSKIDGVIPCKKIVNWFAVKTPYKQREFRIAQIEYCDMIS